MVWTLADNCRAYRSKIELRHISSCRTCCRICSAKYRACDLWPRRSSLGLRDHRESYCSCRCMSGIYIYIYIYIYILVIISKPWIYIYIYIYIYISKAILYLLYNCKLNIIFNLIWRQRRKDNRLHLKQTNYEYNEINYKMEKKYMIIYSILKFNKTYISIQYISILILYLYIYPIIRVWFINTYT